MHFYEAGYADDFIGWRSEVVARFQDILSRKAVPASERVVEKFSHLVRHLGAVVPLMRLKTAVRDLVTSLGNQKAEELETALDRELSRLHTQIREYRQRESIQNYGRFLFTVDIDL